MSPSYPARRKLSIQSLIQQYGEEYLRTHPHLSNDKQNVLKDLAACQTGAFGTHTLRCANCGYQEERPNSCRNRHCAQCGGPRRAKWLDKLLPQLLPTSYLQVVFTLPHALIPLVLRHPRELYDLLFQAGWQTLQQLATDPQHLGAKLGALAVLHTWNQELRAHPHVHFVLPAGGVSLDGKQWVPCRRRKGKAGKPGGYYLFPHKVISRLFRGKFMAGLRKLVKDGTLKLEDFPPSWQTQKQYHEQCRKLYQADWVVYQEAPPPHLEPAALVKYLARYVSGTAIHDARLVSCAGGRVTFTVKNRASGARELREVSINEFLSRYLLHVLPAGLTRIRYYGWWAPRCAQQREQARVLCAASPSAVAANTTQPTAPTAPTAPADAPKASTSTCPRCQTFGMSVVECGNFSRQRVRQLPLVSAAEAEWLRTQARLAAERMEEIRQRRHSQSHSLDPPAPKRPPETEVCQSTWEATP